jgi:negative elongation factor C/D
VFKKGVRKSLNRDEVKATQNFIETAYRICLENKTSSDLLGDLNELFKCIRCAVVSIGIMKWIELTILDPSYFKINSDSSPIHLFILDEIVNCHSIQHDRVLNLLIKVFEYNFSDLDHLIQVSLNFFKGEGIFILSKFKLQLKKTILDRMVHLMSRGHVIQTVKYINKCWKQQDTDISLIRHFVIEVLDMIGPPYSHEFINLFLPLINNENINSSLKAEEEKSIKDFINYCKEKPVVMTAETADANYLIDIEDNNIDMEFVNSKEYEAIKVTNIEDEDEDVDEEINE